MTNYEPLDIDNAGNGERTLFFDGIAVDPDSLDWRPVRKKPVTVDAVRIDRSFRVETMEGTMDAQAGDVLIRGVEGEFYPCDADIFQQSYTDAVAPGRSAAKIPRAAVLLDDALEAPNTAASDALAVRALLHLADHVGADVRFGDPEPGGDVGGGD